MPRPVAVLFDLDGVLIDSRAAITGCINHALRQVGLPPRPVAELTPAIGPPLIDTFARLAGADRAHACLAAYRERYRTASLEETELVPGILPVLAALAAQVPVALATSKPRPFAVALCAALGLAEHLTAVAGPALEDPHEAKGTTVARALDALGLAPGAPVPLVGDRAHDVVGARANGLRCAGVLWGIGSEDELRAAGADVLVATPADLRPVLGL